MIDNEFSLNTFLECGLDTMAARNLADKLAYEVREEVYHILEEYLREVVAKLNRMGHDLKLECTSSGDNLYPGDISYRDDWKDEDGYHCRLRIGINTVVTTGFAHLITDDEAVSPKSLHGESTG